MNGVKHCLETLGPWGAAAAAHLDLLSAVPDSAGVGEQAADLQVPVEGQGDEASPAAGSDTGGCMLGLCVAAGGREHSSCLLVPVSIKKLSGLQ